MNMKLSDIKNKSLLLTGNITKNNVDFLSSILENNSIIYKNFDSAVVVLNGNKSLCDLISKHIKNIIPNCYYIYDFINRGWQFGTIDIERTGYDYIKNNISNCEYIFKIDLDIYLTENILNLDVADFDFLGMPSIGYGGISHPDWNLDMKKLSDIYYDDILYPQSTIYLIKTKCDYLYTEELWISNKYIHHINTNKKAHELGVSCEPLLRKSLVRNNMKCGYMITYEEYVRLLNFVMVHKIVDPSHKNLLFKNAGICHLTDENLVMEFE